MIARGDMGVELPYEEVPIIQKQLVRRALDRGVPSIVATQMLESMIASPRPTRAEASDVANAVFDGADAIMLSGETAIGAYPILAAEAAVRICRLCEERGSEHLAAGAAHSGESDAGALAYAAVALATAEDDIVGIACYTRTGSTARILSSLRPRVPIFAFSPDPAVVSKLALVHGVVGRTCVAETGTADRLGLMAWLLSESRSVPAGAAVVLVASTAAAGSGPNLLEVHRSRPDRSDRGRPRRSGPPAGPTSVRDCQPMPNWALPPLRGPPAGPMGGRGLESGIGRPAAFAPWSACRTRVVAKALTVNVFGIRHHGA